MSAETGNGVTRRIAEFVRSAVHEDVPAEVVRVAKRCVLDGLAVMLAGSSEPCARIARAYAADVDGRGEASTLGEGSFKAPTHLAAFANGIAGHALDWDDTALSLEKDRSVLIHPTMQPLCAGLAVGEHVGATGRDFLTAFILGFEVQVKIAEAIRPHHFAGGRGFHSSGTIGVFGSAATAAKLMGLERARIQNAIAIAATMSAGLGVNHGTMSKPLNMGRAAETGVTAARLASLGFDGPSDALEGGRGFFEALGGGFEKGRILGRLGRPWALLEPGVSVKPYPSGVVGHPGMDAMKRLAIEYDIAPRDVVRIRIRTGSNVIAPGPLRIAHANTALEGKFCVPFQMAAIVLRRKAGLQEFSDDFVRSEACQSMQRRVEASIAPEIEALGKDRIVFDVEVETNAGTRFHRRSEDRYRGGPGNPLSWDELREKFDDCASSMYSAEEREVIISAIDRFDDVGMVSNLADLACRRIDCSSRSKG